MNIKQKTGDNFAQKESGPIPFDRELRVGEASVMPF